MQFIEVEHDELGRTTVPESRFKHIEAKGWRRATGPGPDAYDPADHSVADVTAYLEQASPAERQRVLAAEEDGKARVGVLRAAEQLTDTTDSAPAPLPSVAAPLTTTTPEV